MTPKYRKNDLGPNVSRGSRPYVSQLLFELHDLFEFVGCCRFVRAQKHRYVGHVLVVSLEVALAAGLQVVVPAGQRQLHLV